jgi:hypothetical protein
VVCDEQEVLYSYGDGYWQLVDKKRRLMAAQQARDDRRKEKAAVAEARMLTALEEFRQRAAELAAI